MKRALATALFGAMVLSCGIQTAEPLGRGYNPEIPILITSEVRPRKAWAQPCDGQVHIVRTTREFSYDDAQLLLKIAEAEAGNQGLEGMALVMEVIINRASTSGFPDSIQEVVTQSGQFETVANGTYKKVTPSPEAHLALAMIESGEPYDEKIVGFETSKNGKVLEKYFEYAYTVGDHDFYYPKKK